MTRTEIHDAIFAATPEQAIDLITALSGALARAEKVRMDALSAVSDARRAYDASEEAVIFARDDFDTAVRGLRHNLREAGRKVQ